MPLPRTLELIADYCGNECALVVWQHYAGLPLSIPTKLDDDHLLRKRLGSQVAESLSKFFAGETLYIPTNYCDKRKRNNDIAQLRQSKQKLVDIARIHKLSYRQVINILNQDNPELPQKDLFDD